MTNLNESYPEKSEKNERVCMTFLPQTTDVLIRTNILKFACKNMATSTLSPSGNLSPFTRISLNIDYTAQQLCKAVLAVFLINLPIECGQIPNN